MQSGDVFLLSVLFPGQLRQLREFLGDVAVAAPAMGDQTAAAILDAIADIGEVAAALVAQRIEGTVAEQTVEVLRLGRFVTGEKFAPGVLKEGVTALLRLGGKGLIHGVTSVSWNDRPYVLLSSYQLPEGTSSEGDIMREGGVRMHRRLPYMHRERCGDTAALR